MKILIIGGLLMCLIGCRPVQSIEYVQPGHHDVSYIDMFGKDCALVQCGSEDDLCLVTVSGFLPDQRYILGRARAMNYAEKTCKPIQIVHLIAPEEQQ
jgi:hypothetical protein